MHVSPRGTLRSVAPSVDNFRPFKIPYTQVAAGAIDICPSSKVYKRKNNKIPNIGNELIVGAN